MDKDLIHSEISNPIKVMNLGRGNFENPVRLYYGDIELEIADPSNKLEVVQFCIDDVVKYRNKYIVDALDSDSLGMYLDTFHLLPIPKIYWELQTVGEFFMLGSEYISLYKFYVDCCNIVIKDLYSLALSGVSKLDYSLDGKSSFINIILQDKDYMSNPSNNCLMHSVVGLINILKKHRRSLLSGSVVSSKLIGMKILEVLDNLRQNSIIVLDSPLYCLLYPRRNLYFCGIGGNSYASSDFSIDSCSQSFSEVFHDKVYSLRSSVDLQSIVDNVTDFNVALLLKECIPVGLNQVLNLTVDQLWNCAFDVNGYYLSMQSNPGVSYKGFAMNSDFISCYFCSCLKSSSEIWNQVKNLRLYISS